jgi:hypothetical protein
VNFLGDNLKRIIAVVIVVVLTSTGLIGLGGVDGAQAATVDTRYVEGSDKQAFLFNPLVVNKFDLKTTAEAEAALRADPTNYHAATLKVTTPKGISSTYKVGVRIKGGWGSYRDLDDKAAFKIKMNFSVKGQKLYGIKKFTLNNMVQDPSMLHEAVSYRLFRAMGVAAPRVGYANVLFNGRNYGLHSNIETYDDELFERWYSAKTDHLYEGGYGTEVGPDMEVDEGSKTDKSDVTELQTINNELSGEAWFNAIRAKVNLNQMIMNWAVEHYIGHWDGYTNNWPNNYYVHKPAGGLFTMHPWGTDQTWIRWNALVDDGATMMTRCIQYQPCQDIYLGALTKIEKKLPSLALPTMVDRIWVKILPALTADPRKPYSVEDSTGHMQATKEFMANRFAEVQAFNAARSAPTLSVTYPRSGFKVGGILKPTVKKTGNGTVTFSRIQGDGVCDVDPITGFVTVRRGGTCKVGVQTSRTESHQAVMTTVTRKIPKLTSRIIVAAFNPLAKLQVMNLAVLTDSTGNVSYKRKSGTCRVAGSQVTALASSGKCLVSISVASDANYSKYSRVVTISMVRP